MFELSITRSAQVPQMPATIGLGDIGQRLALMYRTWSTRQALAGLDHRELEDIGMDRPAALKEAARRPWDLAARPRR
jgi:hypothetical protein